MASITAEITTKFCSVTKLKYTHCALMVKVVVEMGLLLAKSAIYNCLISQVKHPALTLRYLRLEFHGTDTDSDTDTDTDILADFRARIVARMLACPATSPFSKPRAGHARQSSPTCPRTFVRHVRFSSLECPLGMRACTRVRTCTVHDKLSCTRLQNYTIGASLMSAVSYTHLTLPTILRV